MPVTVGVHHAKTHLSDLLRRVEEGETVTITRRGEPVAELRPPLPTSRRPVGMLRSWGLTGEDVERVFVGADEDVERDFYGDAYDAVVEASERLNGEGNAHGGA